MAAILPVVVFVLGDRLLSRTTGILAGLGAALYPPLFYFGAWLIAEAPFFALLTLWLYVALRLQTTPTTRLVAAWGVLAGAAFLTKPTVVMHLPFWLIWFLLLPVVLRDRLRLAAIGFAVFALTIALWVARNYGEFGALIPGSTSGGYTFYGANNAAAFGGHIEGFPAPLEGLGPVAQDREYYRLATEWITSHPSDFARLEVRKFRRLLSPFSVASLETDPRFPFDTVFRVIYLGYWLQALFGALLLRRRPDCFLLLIPLLGVLLSTALFYGDLRYTLPAAPSLLLFAAYSIAESVRLGPIATMKNLWNVQAPLPSKVTLSH
jgi:hypothetical protein